MLNLKDGSAVRAAAVEMEKGLQTEELRFLVQEYLPCGMEVVFGAQAGEELGHRVTDLPGIREMDLNRVVAYGDQVAVVDARLAL